MGYHSFLKQKIDNLINYYTSHASVQCGGSYNGNGEYRHILKNRKDITKLLLFDSAPEVIVDQTRLRLPLSSTSICSNKQGVKLHRCAHHLNSSQIFCINVFYPLICNPPALKSVLKDLKVPLHGEIISAQFEYMPNGLRHTNFDFHIATNQNENVYFEVKYTEKGFGAPSKSSRKEWSCFYKEQASACFFRREIADEDVFYHKDFYQVNRIIAYIRGPSDYAVFLMPDQNQTLSLPAYAKEPQVVAINSELFLMQVQKVPEFKDLFTKLLKAYFGH